MMDEKEYHRRYYLAHREIMLKRAKEWARNNKTRINANRRRRYRYDAVYREQECLQSKLNQRIIRKRRKG